MKNISINPNVTFQILDDEMIILNKATGMYHEINSSGIKIWKILESGQIKPLDLKEKILNLPDTNMKIDEIDNFLKDLLIRDILIET